MVEMVSIIASSFLGALVGGGIAGMVYDRKMECCLREIKNTITTITHLEKKNLPPEHPLEAGNVVRFTQNKLIRDWWIGGKKKAKEEQ